MRLSEELLEAMAVGKTGAYNVPTPAEVAKKYDIRSLRRDEISADWIAGIRKWWKKILAEAKSYKGRPPASVSKAGTFKDIEEATESSQAFLRSVYDRLKTLQTDLVVLKGFMPLGPNTTVSTSVYNKKTKKFKTTVKKSGEDAASKKIATEFESAFDALNDITRKMEWTKNDANPEGNPTAPRGIAYGNKIYDDVEAFSFTYASLGHLVDEAMASIDKAVSGRLLRSLSALVKKKGDEKGRYAHVDRKTEPIEDVVRIGKAKLFFQDYPTKPGGRVSTVFPARAPGDSPKFGDVHVGGERTYTAARGDQIGAMKKALALLNRSRLGYLFYGDFRVLPPGTYTKIWGKGKSGRGAGAAYIRGPDDVHLYGNTWASSIIHELGHRYYYKFMTPQERRNFGKWFGKAKAVSEYGSVDTVEDFAELFMHYVDRRELTRDQRQRMEAFLGRKRKLESLADQLRDAITEVAA